MYRALPNLPPESIADDAYGKYLSAADAPGIGDVIAPFSLPVAAGGSFVLPERLDRDLVMIFYRGFW